jgi:multidrug efflux pump subunit AcrA (membrane-fusion protein)
MELTAEVDEIDIALVKPGQEAIIEVDALPALQLDAEVISISVLPEVEEGVVLYEVMIGFDVPEGYELKVGMSATADIIIQGGSGVLLVPNRAIEYDSQGNPIVRVMVNEESEERSVVVGISDGYYTEIVDGLSEGEIVVIER